MGNGEQLLEGLSVVEFSDDDAVRHAGWMLARLGADVDVIRTPSHRQQAAVGAAFSSYLDRGKTVHELDTRDPNGLAELADLMCSARVVLEGQGAGELDKLGLLDVAQDNDGVVVRVSPYGQGGPWANRPASDFTLQAASGMLQRRGEGGTGPIRVGGRSLAAHAGAAMVAAALIKVAASKSAVVDFSLAESHCLALPYPTQVLETRLSAGKGTEIARRALGVVECADGWVGINILTAQQWSDVCMFLDLPQFDDRWHLLRHDVALLDEFNSLAKKRLSEITADAVVDVCQAMRIPANHIGNAATMLEFQQWKERDFFRPGGHGGHRWSEPGTPWRIQSSSRDRPLIEQSTAAPPTQVEDERRPLAGTKVLDLTSYWAGPVFTSILGSFGADVIKVESIQRPDGFRYGLNFMEFGDNWHEYSGIWQSVNLNKRSLTLNLFEQVGRDLFLRLVAEADIVVENYSARVMESFGLDYEALRTVNPTVVMVRMPGFGLEGPWRDHVGWGNAFEQISGAAWVTGEPEQAPTTPGGYADAIVGNHAAAVTLAALNHRKQHGVGMLIEVPQIEIMASVAADQFVELGVTGQVPGRCGNWTSEHEHNFVLGTADPHIDVAVTVENASSAAVRAWLSGTGIADADLDEMLQEFVRKRPPWTSVDALCAEGVAAAVVETAATLRQQEQFRSRGFWSVLERPETGARIFAGWAYPPAPDHSGPHLLPAPTLGQHNREILVDELGLSEDEMTCLERDRVIGTRPL